MRIGLYPMENESAGSFRVEIDGAQIGYAEVIVHFRAGENGILKMIRADRDNEKEIRKEKGVEGRGPVLIVRKYRILRWEAVEGGLLFSCKRA